MVTGPGATGSGGKAEDDANEAPGALPTRLVTPPWVQRASAEGKAGETVMRREAWPLPCRAFLPRGATHLSGLH